MVEGSVHSTAYENHRSICDNIDVFHTGVLLLLSVKSMSNRTEQSSIVGTVPHLVA